MAIRKSMKELLNYFLLLFLFLFSCSLVGMEIFAYRIRIIEDPQPWLKRNPLEEAVKSSPRLNFDDFRQALLSVFCLLVGEDWNVLLY